ncbi:DNA primase family protein [Microaceticoccus formicicus]|uniref:DNA primase family protein n=1 Tax=Microaceticoccus formicicus TaxID=3118105 RepID=UPI003CD0351D|nr:phage/plasmid primase, P4 family [Peptoniphilaceae bacterium AMB_02]
MYVEFKPGEKFSNNLSDISDDHSAFADAGRLLDDNDYVIDIDNLPKEIIKKLIITFDIKTQTVWTERGCHLYFKKPEGFRRGANRVSPLGFEYEIKHKGNTKAVTIKRNGKLREIENEGIRESAPFIFTSNKKFEVLFGMDEGDGRNNALFRLRNQLAGQKDWRKVLTFVNDNIFSAPLSEEELTILTREMVVTAEKDNEYEVANWLMKEMDFLQYGERYYFKVDGEYSHEESLLRQLVYKSVGSQKTRYVDEVIKQMEYRCRKIPQDTVFNIKFNNGYLRDGEFKDIIVDDFTPYNIDIDYDNEAKPVEIVDEYINKLTNSDEDYRNLLLEILGHTLVVDPEFKRMLAKFFIFIGDGGNGKGTLLQIIKTILGSKNVTGLGIKELSDERYLTSFKGMLANLGDDIQDQAINDKDMKMLKNISTCDFISTRELYKSAESMYFTGSLIFTSNHILKSWEKGKSYKRRVLWLPMYTKVEKKDPLFITKLTTPEALEYWMRLIVEGYKRLYENGDFTESEIVNIFNESYHRENNPALDYIEGRTMEDFEDKPLADIYRDYQDWCEDNAVDYNANMISNIMTNHFGLQKKVKWLNGKSIRCFTND